MSKPRKKYNPRKFQRTVWSGEAENAFSKVFSLASIERLSQDEIDSLTTSILVSLETMRTNWCPASYNLICHFYRVARIVATEMEIGLLTESCDKAWNVLNDLYEGEGKPIPTASQYDVLWTLVDVLLVLLPEIPRPLWEMAEKVSRETVKQRMTEQYLLLPEWARIAAIHVLSGKTVKDISANLQRKTKEVSEYVRMAGAILYSINEDTSIPFPDSVINMRKLGGKLLPIAAMYEQEIQLQKAAMQSKRTAKIGRRRGQHVSVF